MSIVTENWYRDRQAPYTGTASARTYFATHQPGEWKANDELRALYAAVYGQAALQYLDAHGLVCENKDNIWVAGAGVRPSFREPDAPTPTEPGPDEVWVNTPMGRQIVKKSEVIAAAGGAVDLAPVLAELAIIRQKLVEINGICATLLAVG